MKTAIFTTFLIFSMGLLFGQQTIEELKKENEALKDSIANTTKLVDAISTLNKRLNRDFDGDKKNVFNLG
ncbi:MAG: hypothetical protein IPM34_09560 [Saprospiraceae bacterium]|nr:hypothetical protein [Saprospiraceae bacterium]